MVQNIFYVYAPLCKAHTSGHFKKCIYCAFHNALCSSH